MLMTFYWLKVSDFSELLISSSLSSSPSSIYLILVIF